MNCESKVSCTTPEREPRPGLESEPFDLEPRALTIRPPHLPTCHTAVKRGVRAQFPPKLSLKVAEHSFFARARADAR